MQYGTTAIAASFFKQLGYPTCISRVHFSDKGVSNSTKIKISEYAMVDRAV